MSLLWDRGPSRPRRSRSRPARHRSGFLLAALAALIGLTGTGLFALAVPATADNSYPPPPLLDATLLSQQSALIGLQGGVYTATSAEQSALDDLQSEAITDTLQAHGLPASDATAVQTWGRQDALAQLYGLLIQAVQTPTAQQTTDQAEAAAWFTSVVQRQDVVSADDAGLEYAKWSGIGASAYQSELAGNPSESDLAQFLSANPIPYGSGMSESTPPSTTDANEGYCVYQSPSEAPTSYTANLYTDSGGNADPTCFGSCPDPATGCFQNPPTYSQFVGWGTADADDDLLAAGSSDAGTAANQLARAIDFGIGAAAGTGAGLVTTEGLAFLPTQTFAAVFPWARLATFALPAINIGAAVGIVITAIVLAVEEGINVAQATELPGQLATLVTSAPTTTPDLSTMATDDTNGGAQELFSLFLGATLPQPTDTTCNNNVISVGGAGSAIPVPCLNAPPIPAASASDPTFDVSRQGSGTGPTASSTITLADTESGTTTSETARLSGTWWVDTTSGGSDPSATTQSLEISYTDWNGNEQTAWVADQDGTYSFLTAEVSGSTGTDPSDCTSSGTCTASPSIDYVDPNGNEMTATLVPPPPLPSPPTITSVVQSSDHTSATVSFQPAPVTGEPVTGYTVTATDLTNPSGTATETGAASPITVSGLTAGGDDYSVTVAATNEVGTGAASAPVTFTTGDVETPGAPTDVTTQPGPADGDVTVAFSPPTDQGGSPVTSYTVTGTYTPFSINPTPPLTVGTATGTTSPIVVDIGSQYDTNVAPLDDLTFTVTATNAAGSGPASAPVAGAPVAAPTQLTGITATAGDGQATVNWAPTQDFLADPTYSVVAYDLTEPANGGQTASTTNALATSLTVTGLTGGDEYELVVTVTNPVGQAISAPSNGVVPTGPPDPPVNVTLSRPPYGNNGTLIVAFDSPANDGGTPITGYTVTATYPLSIFTETVTASGTSSPISLTGLNDGYTYTVTVTATNADGTSSPSSPPVSAEVTPAPPEPPTGVSAMGGDGQATVAFTPPADDGGSPIDSYTVTASDSSNPQAPPVTATGGSSPVAVGGLTNGDDYTFTVTATNYFGTSLSSTAAGPTEIGAAPDAPSSVQAAGGIARATVSFGAPASDGGLPVTGYTVSATDTTDAQDGGQTSSGPSSPLTVTGLTPGDAYTFAVTATNQIGTGPAATSNTVTALSPLAISTTALGDAPVAVPYRATVSATGGLAPYTFKVAKGALPDGLALDPATGVISGTPRYPARSPFTLEVTDAEGTPATATEALSVTANGCTLTVAGNRRSLAVGRGVTCLKGATVSGPVTVATGASLVSIGSVIDGPLTATGADLVTLCSTSVLGGAQLRDSTGPLTLGTTYADGAPRCSPDVLAGALTIAGPTGPVEVARSSVTGPLTLTGDTGPSALVKDDHVGATLACAGNTSTPVDLGRPSTAQHATGQCAGLVTRPKPSAADLRTSQAAAPLPRGAVRSTA